jgi:hypothetical protein
MLVAGNRGGDRLDVFHSQLTWSDISGRVH